MNRVVAGALVRGGLTQASERFLYALRWRLVKEEGWPPVRHHRASVSGRGAEHPVEVHQVLAAQAMR